MLKSISTANEYSHLSWLPWSGSSTSKFNNSKILEEEKTAKGKPHDGIKVLEALAATGLRSVRYMKEIPSIKTLVSNDIDKAATDLMTKNFEFNECPETKFKGKYYHSYPSLILF